MSNTSATGGYLVPSASPAPLQDDALVDAFQAAVVGITGLPGNLVRPRWQPKPPKTPDATADWVAVGVTVQDTPGLSPAISHNSDTGGGVGADTLRRNENIEVFLSFYGPNAGKYAGIVADGFSIPQNNEVLKTNLMIFVNRDTIRQASEVINEQWVPRQDLRARFRRRVVRVYPVENIVSADVQVTSDNF